LSDYLGVYLLSVNLLYFTFLFKILVLWLSGNGPRLVNALTDSMLSELITKHLKEVLQDKNIRPPVKIIR